MTFVSLFAGVGGFDAGLERNGHQCVGQCEIDPHARTVLERHWPTVPKHDDVTTLKADTFDHPDIVTFGSPCQDLSVAGKRTGLTGERSGLFLQAVRYIREVQEATSGRQPKLAIWENVPGAFSSNDGHDFAAVLQGLVGGTVRRPTDGWGAGGTYAGVAFGPLGSAEWRVLDSQHFGVPQRRNRVFLVYRPGGESAGSVLLESQGMPGNLEAGGEAGSNIAGAITGGLGSGGPSDNNAQAGHIIPILLAAGAGMDRPAGIPEEAGYVIPTSFNWQAAPAQGLMIDHDQTGPLDASQTKAIAFSSKDYGHDAGTISPTLRAMNHDASHANGGGQVAVAFAMRGRDDGAMPEVEGDGQRVSALRAAEGGSTRDMIAFEPRNYTRGQAGGGPIENRARALTGRGRGDIAQHVTTHHAVRRLTPRECERLQGFPDDWTRYRPDGTEIADTHRYRMMGNAVTVNVVEWLGRRLA